MASTLAGFQSSGIFPVGTLKTLMYAAALDNEQSLHHRIVDACQTIRNYPGIFARMRRSVMSTYFKCTLSAITHKLNVFGHMILSTFFLVSYVELMHRICLSFRHILVITLSVNYIRIWFYSYMKVGQSMLVLDQSPENSAVHEIYVEANMVTSQKSRTFASK
jgi:hypothetical protein